MTTITLSGGAGLALERVNSALRPLARGLQFGPDDTGNMVMRVVDPHTNEILRQMPAAHAQAIARALERVQGLLIDEKA